MQVFKPNSIVDIRGKLYNLREGSIPGHNGSISSYNLTEFKSEYLKVSDLEKATFIDPTNPAQAARLPEIVMKQPVSGFTGADPEIFAFSAKGAVVPAWEFLEPPTAKQSMYWDGVQAEFTPKEGHCHEGLADRVRLLLISMQKALQTKFPDAVLRPQDVVKLDKQLLLEGEEQYLKLGCGRSWNAYDMQAIEVPDFRKLKYRFAGAHFHHSLSTVEVAKLFSSSEWFPKGTVVMMDKIAGLCLTALGRNLEDPLRRKYYGRPGEFRVPNQNLFHLEYRTPSNFVLWSPQVYNFASDITRIAYRMGLYQDGVAFAEIPDVKEIIMQSDADAAWKTISKCKALFTKIFEALYENNNYADKDKNRVKPTFAALREGLKSFVGLRPLSEAWKFDAGFYGSWNDNHTMGWRGLCEAAQKS